jgi:hypothetical protein
MIAAVGTRGHLRFIVHKAAVTADVICDFLNGLMHGAQEPIFLIWGGGPHIGQKRCWNASNLITENLKYAFCHRTRLSSPD